MQAQALLHCLVPVPSCSQPHCELSNLESARVHTADIFQFIADSQSCVQEVLQGFLGKLARQARTAEDFRDVAGEYWGPRVAAYVCAAHYLAHALRTAAGPLLLVDAASGMAACSCTLNEAQTMLVCQ